MSEATSQINPSYPLWWLMADRDRRRLSYSYFKYENPSGMDRPVGSTYSSCILVQEGS